MFVDIMSGSLEHRPELDKLLDQIRPDDTLVVWRLDRLGRSIRHLLDQLHTLDHQQLALGHDELQFVLERRWRKLGKTLDLDDFTDAQAFAAVERTTRGKFRCLEHRFP